MNLNQLSLDNVCEDTPTIVFTNDYFTTYGGMIHGRILKPNSHSRSQALSFAKQNLSPQPSRCLNFYFLASCLLIGCVKTHGECVFK
jgi:hypothetical protein